MNTRSVDCEHIAARRGAGADREAPTKCIRFQLQVVFVIVNGLALVLCSFELLPLERHAEAVSGIAGLVGQRRPSVLDNLSWRYSRLRRRLQEIQCFHRQVILQESISGRYALFHRGMQYIYLRFEVAEGGFKVVLAGA